MMMPIGGEQVELFKKRDSDLAAVTIEAKLSSMRIRSATNYAICVPPAIPTVNPILARFNAGASLVPSPTFHRKNLTGREDSNVI